MASTETANQTLRKAALVAGVGLLIMAVVAGFTNFAIFESLITRGDAEKTAAAIFSELLILITNYDRGFMTILQPKCPAIYSESEPA